VEAESAKAFLKVLYDTYRTERMNSLYYGGRLAKSRRQNQVLELAIAIGTSTTVPGWIVWKEGPGAIAWASISGLAALLAIAKPILNYGAKIERYQKLFGAHCGLYLDLKNVVQDIRISQSVLPAHEVAFAASRERAKDLSSDDDPDPNLPALKKAQDDVNKSIRPQDLWMPA
jgi:hypothetical protein